MSVYPQSHAYGQVQFPAQGYPQPGLSNYPYHQPPPPSTPVYFVDPNAFRRDYAARVSELTINSRPIIQNLSMIAQDYSRWADVVAQCIEAHIKRVPAWMKLPAFYLLDAISKNVFEPYARHFAAFVTPLFLETYEQVDQATRSKMEEMLLTWRTGAPNGKELFGIVPQIAIERGVWGGGDSSSTDPKSAYGGSGQISKMQVLSELEFALGQKERALHSSPYDQTLQKHVDILQQLRKLVEAGVSQDELRQILSQLRTLTRVAPPPPPQQPIPPHPSASATQSYPSTSYAQSYPPPLSQPSYSRPPAQSNFSSANVHPPQPPPQTQTYPFSAPEQVKPEPRIDLSTLLSLRNAVNPNPPPPPPPVNNIASIFGALLKAGVVSADGTPIGAGATAKAEGTPQPAEAAEASDPRREASRAYRKSILSSKIKLTTADITKKQTRIVHFLYDRLPIQCKQCGIRFSDNVIGKKDMEGHLDMHFRQNRKANQNVGRGHSRSWFVGLEDWIHDTGVDTKGKGSTGTRRMSAKAAAAAEAAKREAELRAQFVVVPPGDEAKLISCPICKETIQSEFVEDDEDWVWKNAVKKDDRIHHATCHAEAVASTHSLAARLRNEMSGRSRSGTPESASSRVSPPKAVRKLQSPSADAKSAGVKRKAENDNPSAELSVTNETDSTPPKKKLAISS